MKKNEDEGAPKSAYELAMERLLKRDQEAGEGGLPLSEEQRGEIAEVKKVYQAKLAEQEILHKAALKTTHEPEARATLEEQYQRERERTISERDRKLDSIRSGKR